MAARRGRTWDKEETLELLEKWGDDNVQELLRTCKRKKPIWDDISLHLKALGYQDRAGDACKTRIHTLISSYRKYKDACNKSGNGKPAVKPAYYEEMESILGDKPCTKPRMLVSSLQTSAKKPTIPQEDEEDDVDEDFGDELRRVEDHCIEVVTQDEPAELDENNSVEEKYVPKKKKRRTTSESVVDQMKDTMSEFMKWQRESEEAFLQAELERERREVEREEKRKKEDQEFLLKLASVLKK